jgi:hypothetical protein
MPVRKKIILRFQNSYEDLKRYRFLTYLWLRTTGQLGDEKAVKASCDLKRIVNDKFVQKYACKYALKSEQKVFMGEVNEATGEITNNWTGRFWGSRRTLKNEILYSSQNPKTVRAIGNWYKSYLKSKRKVGLRLIFTEEESNRLKRLVAQLESHGMTRDDPTREARLEGFNQALRSVKKGETYTDDSLQAFQKIILANDRINAYPGLRIGGNKYRIAI